MENDVIAQSNVCLEVNCGQQKRPKGDIIRLENLLKLLQINILQSNQ